MSKLEFPKGYRVISREDVFDETVDGFHHVLELQRWESVLVGPWWRRRIDFKWVRVAKEYYDRFPTYPNGVVEKRRMAALARLHQTALLEEETRPIELRWSERVP